MAMTAAQDEAYDKAHGIKLGSAEDRKLDKERGVSDDGPKYGRKKGRRARLAKTIRKVS